MTEIFYKKFTIKEKAKLWVHTPCHTTLVQGHTSYYLLLLNKNEKMLVFNHDFHTTSYSKYTEILVSNKAYVLSLPGFAYPSHHSTA